MVGTSNFLGELASFTGSLLQRHLVAVSREELNSLRLEEQLHIRGIYSFQELNLILKVMNSYWALLQPLVSAEEAEFLNEQRTELELRIGNCSIFYEEARAYGEDTLFLLANNASYLNRAIAPEREPLEANWQAVDSLIKEIYLLLDELLITGNTSDRRESAMAQIRKLQELVEIHCSYRNSLSEVTYFASSLARLEVLAILDQ